jgi:hypothetical protein
VLVNPIRYFERFLPTTTLGLGAADFNYKLGNITHAILLETGTPEVFNKYRYEVKSWTSDQGLEYSVCDGPNLAFVGSSWGDTLNSLRIGEIDVSSPDVEGNFLFPRCLGVPDCLHILFNALESAVTSSDSWEWISDHYATLAKFLGDLGMRRRFQATCLVSDKLNLVTQWVGNTSVS